MTIDRRMEVEDAAVAQWNSKQGKVFVTGRMVSSHWRLMRRSSCVAAKNQCLVEGNIHLIQVLSRLPGALGRNEVYRQIAWPLRECSIGLPAP